MMSLSKKRGHSLLNHYPFIMFGEIVNEITVPYLLFWKHVLINILVNIDLSAQGLFS